MFGKDANRNTVSHTLSWDKTGNRMMDNTSFQLFWGRDTPCQCSASVLGSPRTVARYDPAYAKLGQPDAAGIGYDGWH